MTLADIATQHVKEPAEAWLRTLVPEEYAKFVPLAVRYALRSAGVWLAFVIARFGNAACTAARGAQLMTGSLLDVLGRNGLINADTFKDPALRSQVHMAIALLGMVVQFYLRFTVPFPLNLVLLPISILEWTLMAVLGASVPAAQ